MFLWNAVKASKRWLSPASELVVTEAFFESLREACEQRSAQNQAKVNEIVQNLCMQAQENFELFMHNMSALESYHALRVNILSSYLIPKLLALSSKEPLKYNACIKRLITNGLMNGPVSIPLKKQWLLDAVNAENKEIVVWFFEEGELSLNDPIVPHIVRHYPLIIHLSNNLQFDKLSFLLSLKYSNNKPVVTAAELDYEVVIESHHQQHRHTALERVLVFAFGGLQSEDSLMPARMLRQHGASNFGSLPSLLKEEFLAWEKRVNLRTMPLQSGEEKIVANQNNVSIKIGK